MIKMAINKFVYFGETKFDTTSATITPDKILSGYKGVDKAGDMITGTCTFDSDTSSATATAAEILSTKTAYVAGSKVTGTMPNNGSVTGTISTKAGQYTVPSGYHDGSGKVGIASTEQSKLIPGNIKKGVTILGVLGTLDIGSFENPQAKTVTPTASQQTVTPDAGYTCLSQVVVEAIPYSETPNAFGTTITIG